MAINATFNNISVISLRSVSLVEETRKPGENHRPTSSHWKLYHITVYLVHLMIISLFWSFKTFLFWNVFLHTHILVSSVVLPPLLSFYSGLKKGWKYYLRGHQKTNVKDQVDNTMTKWFKNTSHAETKDCEQHEQ